MSAFRLQRRSGASRLPGPANNIVLAGKVARKAPLLLYLSFVIALFALNRYSLATSKFQADIKLTLLLALAASPLVGTSALNILSHEQLRAIVKMGILKDLTFAAACLSLTAAASPL